MALLGKFKPRAWTGTISPVILPFATGRLKPGMQRSRADNQGLPETLGRIGSLEVRLARTSGDVKRAQKLRYKVFYDEMSAIPDTISLISGCLLYTSDAADE